MCLLSELLLIDLQELFSLCLAVAGNISKIALSDRFKLVAFAAASIPSKLSARHATKACNKFTSGLRGNEKPPWSVLCGGYGAIGRYRVTVMSGCSVGG